MPSRINTVVLGAVEPHLVDILAIEGRGTPRFSLRTARGAHGPAPAQAETVLVSAVAPDMPLLDDDLRPLFGWIERVCRDPGLSEVHSSAVPAVLRVMVECGLDAICARCGCRLTVIMGQRPDDVDRDEHCAAEAYLTTLAAAGVDLVHLVSTATTPSAGRAVVCRPLAQKFLMSLDAAGLDVLDAVFATSEQIAEATGLSDMHAVALQLAMAEQALRCRAAVWLGAGSALDVRLAAQAAALRRLALSGVGQPHLHSGSLEPHQLHRGEVVAMVPFFDTAAGTSSLVPMEPDSRQRVGTGATHDAAARAPHPAVARSKGSRRGSDPGGWTVGEADIAVAGGPDRRGPASRPSALRRLTAADLG